MGDWSLAYKKWETGRGHMYTYGWFMLMFDRQQNSVKQLSFNQKINKLKKEMGDRKASILGSPIGPCLVSRSHLVSGCNEALLLDCRKTLKSRCRKTSVRDKKWVYLERNTLHRQCEPSQKVRAADIFFYAMPIQVFCPFKKMSWLSLPYWFVEVL